MPEEHTIPSSQPRSGATFSILSNGEKLPDSIPVLSVMVHHAVNRISKATIMMQDGNAASGEFTAGNGEWLTPGKEIEIKAGYRSDEETIFKGLVVKQNLKIRKQISLLVIECRHQAVKMTTHRHNNYFYEKTDSEVASELCGKYGISLSESGDYLSHKELVQYYSSDWDYMLCRAEANGMWVVTSLDGGIAMAPPDTVQAAVLTAKFGSTLKDLDVEMDSRLQYKEWKAVGWDLTQQRLMDDTATEITVPQSGNLAADALADATANNTQTLLHSSLANDELKKWADATLQKNRLAKLRGSAKVDGTALAWPGKILELAGAGERFNGKLMMTGLRHQLEKNQWETTIQFGDNPKWHAETFELQPPLAGALIPAIEGLHIGVVTDLEDPDLQERVKVRMPLVSENGEGAWMRLASLDAGKKRGWVFRPELNDEVVVGFLNNDPRFGVVLGMLHSNDRPAPIEAKNDNHEKGLATRSEMKIHLDDDLKIMTLSTPAGNTLALNEDTKSILLQDQHGNKIEMNEDGILLESIKEVKIKAGTEITAEANTDIKMKANRELKAEGAASAELSAGGNTVVKGAIVQIN